VYLSTTIRLSSNIVGIFFLQEMKRRRMSGVGGYEVGQVHDTNDVKDACVGCGSCSKMRKRGSLNADSDSEFVSWIMCKSMV
jgi:hypothetical protein